MPRLPYYASRWSRRAVLQLVLLVATWHSASTRPLDGDGPLAEVGATPAVPAHSYAAYKANVTSSYFTNEDVNTFMRLMADECAHMMSLFSIGQSASGRELLALDISYTSAIRDGKPSFHYIGNMHGNEPSGRQLLLQLAVHMCDNSDVAGDATVERLLSSVHLIVVPTANPDGFAANHRENSRRVDLNRDFPTRLTSSQTRLVAKGTEQPETKALMKLMTSFRFTAGVNLHEGALVANFPWDNIPEAPKKAGYAAAWDDSTFRMLASSYARLHTRMSTQASSKYQPQKQDEYFEGGITNGNEWYPVVGGFQDFAYLEGHCMEVTLELWESKRPEAALLAELWRENSAALLQLPLRALLGGVTGTVHRARSDALGPPIPEAVVTLEGSPVTTYVEAAGGKFSRPLPSGVHNVTVSAPGYQTYRSQVYVPADYTGASLDIHLHLSDPTGPVPVQQGPHLYPYVVTGGRHSATRAGQTERPARTAVPAAQPASAEPGATDSSLAASSGRVGPNDELILMSAPLQPPAAEHSLVWYSARTVLVIAGPLALLYELVRRRSRARTRQSL